MKDISHREAVKLIHLRLDGLLNDSQGRSLNEHLDTCASCQTYAAEMELLPTHLQREFHLRWDQDLSPSHRVLQQVTSKAKRIPVANRITSSIRLMASGFLVAFLILGINYVILQMKSTPIDTIGTQSVSGSELINNRLIAFTSEKDGNFDIYTMSADGSNLTNLTNNPAQDVNPVWSPDGKHIVFESDRAGRKQIYLMNSDGSNIVQLTNDEVDHQLPVTYDSQHSIWSSDGSKILFLQNDQDGKTWTLSSINIKGENKTTLFSDTRQFDTASWSPTGNYVGLALFDEPEPDRLLPNLYVIDADGNNLREIRKFLSNEEQIFFPYVWSSDGQSVIFPADKFDPYRQTIYELRLSDNTLSTLDMIQASLFDWYDGIALVADFNIESQPLVWLRPDGTATTLDYLKGANPVDCYIDKERSLRGNLAIGSYCKQDDKVLLYWTNVDGSNIQQLPDFEVPIVDGGHIGGLTLSPDEKFVTFNFESDDETNLYIWNIEDALNDPSVQPIKIVIGKGELHYFPSWQPVVNNDILEEEQAQTDNRLIAFTSDQGGNAEIYTMYSDGSDLTNITNYSAHDVNPIWSPDGKRIAFESDRTGFIQIYTMNPDGSNLMQITNEEADHAIGTKYGNMPEPWSPDGKKIIFSQTIRGDENCILYVMDIDGSNKIALTREPGVYTFLGWSPDGQKIVYQTPNLGHNAESRITIANVDGTGTIDGIVRKDFGIPSQIQWEGPDQLVLLAYNSNVDPPSWQISRMFVTTDTSVYNGFGPTIADSNVPIVALFENTYVAEDQDALRWFAFNGSPIPTSPWNFPSVCEKPVSDPFMPDTFHSVSPDRNHAIVVVFCGEGAQFYLENADGTQVDQVRTPIPGQSQVNELTWSPDGKHVIVTTSTDSSTNSTNLFRFDVQEMLNDPSVKPIQLTTDDAWKYGVVWQPMISNEVTEKESTPEPTQISSADSLITFTADNNDAANINTDIYTIRLDGSNLTNLTHDPAEDFNANDYNPAWSPDRKKIAFMSDHRGSTTGNTNIFVMNPDGSGLSQLTYNPGYDAFLSWSPDGQRIVYFSSPIAESNVQGQLIVMNADGSDKTILTTVGYYYFRSWSPDSQKIVYVEPRFKGERYQDAGIYVVDIDGKNRLEWFADNINQIHWEDSEHFLGVVQTGEDTQATWSLYQFNTNGSQIELTSHNGPMVAIFERSYVVEGQDGLTWFALEGVPLSSSPWNVAEKCVTTSGSYVSTNLSISPDQKRALVTIYCKDATWHYLVNEDGSEIHQLGAPMDGSFGILPHWSPDGQYVSLFVINYQDDLYLIDIQKMLNDPSDTPLLLATNVLAGMAYAEPLIASNDEQEKQTPEPPAFSLSVYEAELLAFFDVLEPSYLPTGYTLEGVAYNPWTQQVAMKYVSQQGNVSILIYQQRGDLLHDPAVSGYVTPVPVGDREGEYVQGAWIYESPDTTIPTWDPSAESYSLTWQNGEFVFSINFVGGETITPLPLNELVAIAESLK